MAIDSDIPDELARKLDQALLPFVSEKSNSETNRHLCQSILAATDAKMDDVTKEMGLNNGHNFVNEKNTYEKISPPSKLLHQQGIKKGV